MQNCEITKPVNIEDIPIVDLFPYLKNSGYSKTVP